MLARVAQRPDVDILLPMHLNPEVRKVVTAELSECPAVHLVEPLAYPAFVHALKTSYLAVTDSGGIQEEAPTFGVPVLVMRNTTERPEGVAAGCARLCGTNPRDLEQEIYRLLDDPLAHARMATAKSPYGDGFAASRILDRLRFDLLNGSPAMGVASRFTPIADAEPAH
jgi:UDP-N-acetylglucosamine 2-epimerase (non-hydrolysing)